MENWKIGKMESWNDRGLILKRQIEIRFLPATSLWQAGLVKKDRA